MSDYSKLFKDSVEDFLNLLKESDFIKRFFVILVDMIQFGIVSNLQELELEKSKTELIKKDIKFGSVSPINDFFAFSEKDGQYKRFLDLKAALSEVSYEELYVAYKVDSKTVKELLEEYGIRKVNDERRKESGGESNP